MKTMNWINITLAILVGILVILYLIILPIAKHRSIRKNQEDMDKFFNSLSKGDQVVLLSGVVGTIENVGKHYINLKVAENSTIKVDKHGIASKLKNKANTK